MPLTGHRSAAVTAWDESLSGELSNLGASPATVSLVAGSNRVNGATRRGNDTIVDRDCFGITLAAGLQLDAVTLLRRAAARAPALKRALRGWRRLSLPAPVR